MTSQAWKFRLHLIGIALFALCAAAVFIAFLSLSGVQVVPHATYTLKADVPETVALADHADVRESGVKVGEVTRVALDGGRAVLTLSIDKKYGPVYRDGQIAIREKTLLGENYVDLDPGQPSSGALRSGATLPTLAPEATQLDQVLSTLDKPHRQDVRTILAALGGGFGTHGAALNRFLGAQGQLVANGLPVGSVLNADRTQVASLINDFGAVTAALGERATALQRLSTSTLNLSRAVAVRDSAMKDALRTLPGFVAQARTTSARLGAFSDAATPVVRNLRLATGALLPAFHRLGPASQAAASVMRDLGPFAQTATTTANALRSSAPVLTSFAHPLGADLQQLDPMLAYIAPYSFDIGTLFPSLANPSQYTDATGNYGRVTTVISPSILTGASGAEETLLKELADAGLVSALDKEGANPYPAPHSHNSPAVNFTGTYHRVEPDAPYTLKKP